MSGKAPAFQFYPGDWLRDPELGLASAATQGVWINFLCQMWFARDRGVLSGNLSQLAQLGRCQSDDVVRFLSEAKALKFCDVSEDGHGIVTVTNRRMANEEKARVFARERKARERERKSESRASHTENPQLSRECHSASPDLRSPDLPLQGKKEGPSDLVPNGTQNGATRKPEAPDPDTLKPEDLQESWNEHLAPLGLPRVAELSGTRRKKALARLHEHPKIGFWEQVIGNIRGSPFLRGLRPKPGHENWRASFDWLIENDTNAVKVYEGRYGAG